MYNYLVAFVVALLVIVGTVFLCSGAINYTQDPVALGTSDWIKKLQDKDKNVRIESLIELGKSKDNLDQVVPAVVGQLGELDPLVSVAASQAMVALGEPAVPHIKPFLESDDYKTYALGCIACREMGEPCAVYVPLLRKRIQTGDERVQGRSIDAMSNFGKSALPALDEIRAGLDAKVFMTQVVACKTLASLGRDAKPAGPRLVELAEKGNLSARSWATVALGAIGPVEEYDVVAILDGKLDEFLLLDKQRALKGLALIGPPAKAALPNIERLMNDNSKSCPHDAAYAYWKISGDSKLPVSVLVELLSNVDFQAETIDLLGDMGPAAKSSVPELIKLLGSDEVHLRESAVLSLGAIGPGAKAALPALRKMKNDPDLLVRSAAARSIKEIGKNQP